MRDRPTFAQTFRGTILGSVTDSSGAAVPGATVTIKNLDTGLVRTVTTSDDGSYSAPELPIGNYSVSPWRRLASSSVWSTGIKVEVSSERRADVSLQPGQLAQTVTVQGEELPMVESTSNTLGGIIESKIVTSLPVNGRDYQKLIFLVPGVTGSPDQITDSPGAFGIFSVNGARGRANNFLLDGTDMNDGYRNDPAINEAGVFGTPATILPVEAIAEFHVASNFEAEYGRSAGARCERRHQERDQPDSRFGLRIFPQQCPGRAKLFQRYLIAAESISRQSVWRVARRADHQRQNVLLL